MPNRIAAIVGKERYKSRLRKAHSSDEDIRAMYCMDPKALCYGMFGVDYEYFQRVSITFRFDFSIFQTVLHTGAKKQND